MLNGLNVGLITILIGLYGIANSKNSLKMMMCLSLMGTGVILLFVSIGYIPGGAVPVARGGKVLTDAIPQSVMVTAIVIDLATTALGLAMVLYLYRTYSTLDFASMLELEKEDDEQR